MQFWDTIINTAMMGTDKKQISASDMPAAIEEVASLVNENNTKDKEEKFIQLAAIAYNYRQCGIIPAQKEIMMPLAPAEEKEYCNQAALQALQDIISEESMPLLKFWIQHCYEKQQIVSPEMVPLLLQTGTQQKKLQLLIASCCGKRGEWLSSFNPAWIFSSAQTDEELWQTGTIEQRKEILKQIRKTDPVKARELVEQTWALEDAATKTSFLEILGENAVADDIPFLEGLLNEKSKKVKEEALKLLKQIPGSTILEQYQEVIRQTVSIKKGKVLLGMGNKTTLDFHLPASIPEEVFKSGIEKLSGQKNISDESFIVYQLVSYIPPFFWKQHLECSAPEVIELFKKSEEGKRMIPALGLAVSRFKEIEWAKFFIEDEKSFYSDLVPFLEKKERESYLLKFINVNTMTDAVIQLAIKEEEEWGIELTKAIFRHIAKNPYQYNRSFYNQYIHLIPVHIVGELERCTPPEENLRTMWSNTSEYIIKLITLKIQTIKAFNP